jgi:hypothetical protein
MRHIPLFGIALLATALHAAPASAAVEVTFAGSNYTDINVRDRPVYGSIRTILQQLGTRYLSRGDRLSITVLDVNLAGFDLSSMGPSRIRILNGATPPKIRLRYRLVRNGKLADAGEDLLSDQMYMSRPGGALSSDEFRYEREMLDNWFREKFSAGR